MRLPTNKGRHVLCRGSVSSFTLQLPGVATKDAATKVGNSEQDTKAAFHDFLALRPASSHVDTWMQWHDGAVVFDDCLFEADGRRVFVLSNRLGFCNQTRRWHVGSVGQWGAPICGCEVGCVSNRVEAMTSLRSRESAN